ncbi:hypothetical protein E1A91_A06G132500v1 [Gossypium mustelinum]|uniref:Uncharacterized protein n=1 Tax=Gossypium mustelinum TaxID=34275 RepID=A0A5D2YWR1_GOSMU|nr:hypothetical protein E1A91_A06G132500v1 [Gossypium mustelinum]
MDSFPRSLNPNKHLREQFVSNLPGSSMLEVSALLNNVALLMLLRHTFCSQTVNALDYVFIVLPTLLIFNVLVEWVYICMIRLLFLLILFTAVKRTYSLPYMEGPNASRASISSYRVVTMFITCLCILAVDFRIYPREYAKTETYVTSLHEALAGVSILTSILNVPAEYSGILACFFIFWYLLFDCWLINGLNIYLLSNERGTDVISRNKEGIFSLFGYWGMYLIGVQVSYYLFFENHTTKQRSKHETRIRICLLTIMFCKILTLLIDRYVERISRRMCNLAYVTWVVAQNLQLIAPNILNFFLLHLRRGLDGTGSMIICAFQLLV